MKNLPDNRSSHLARGLDNLKGEVGAEVDTIEADTPEDTKVISVISQQSLECECISTSLKYRFPEAEIRCFDSPDAWEESFDGADTNEVVLYSLEESGVLETETKEELRRFVDKAGTRKVIVLSKSDDLNALFDVLECGAASYIPPDVGLNDLIEAMRISSTKSVVIPRKSILALRGAAIAGQEAENGLERYFTERQLAVARALQQGAANKTIAYQLDLRESTVKVHVRNIMRKLQATNRTQAAFKLNELANGNIEMDIAAKT